MLGKNTDLRRTNRLDLTKVSIASICLVLVFALTLSTSGCGKGGLPGKNAPEYEPMLDWEYWMDTFGPDAYKGMMDREEKKILNAAMDVIGLDNLEQTELQATKTKDMVSARSVLKYKGGKKDNAFIGAMTAWKPAKPGMIKGFQPEGLLGMFAIGNPVQLIDLMAEWAIESGQIEDFIDELPEYDRAEAKAGFKYAKMTAKGVLAEARDEYFPLFGDEIVVAVYANDDFIGWEDQWEAEGFEEASPVHVIAAIELSKPGLAEMIEDLIDENEEMIADMFGGGRSYYDDRSGEWIYEEPEFNIRSKEVGGVEISYFEIEEDFSIAWAEFKNIFFIGNLEAIENLGDFYQPGKSQFAMTLPYCKYAFVNADEIVALVPDEAFDELEDSLDYMGEYMDDDYVEMMEDMADILLDSDDFGTFQVIMQTVGSGFETTLSCGIPIADLIMIGFEFAEYSMGEGMY